MLNQKDFKYNERNFSFDNYSFNYNKKSSSSKDSNHSNSSDNIEKSDYFSINKKMNLIQQKLLSLNDNFSPKPNIINIHDNNKVKEDNNNEEDSSKRKFINAKNVLKELNSQLTKMNYCNIIQTNSIQRLDLSLSFLSSQIDNLNFLNKKRKDTIQKNLDKFKNQE